MEHENNVKPQSCQNIPEPEALISGDENEIIRKNNSEYDGILTQTKRQRDPDYI